ncbi:MAG: transcription termination/antitermination protein NusA, partial [Deltaproteobacteria bacterium]|nr:transcription termination/antitermination protein NusA [Deltaproteobacteria bacterium]
CVGMKGSRVQAVVQELRGEKIDIVPWDPDPAKFICNGLAPAEIIRVIVDEENRTMEVVVPDDQLSLAIGKRGQNVRLASKISGWNLDVTSETDYNRALKEAYDSLLQLDGVGEKTALNLYQEGFRSAEEVAVTPVSDLIQLRDIGEEKAKKIIESAIQCVARKKAEEMEAASSQEDGPADDDSENGDAPKEDETLQESEELKEMEAASSEEDGPADGDSENGDALKEDEAPQESEELKETEAQQADEATTDDAVTKDLPGGEG